MSLLLCRITAVLYILASIGYFVYLYGQRDRWSSIANWLLGTGLFVHTVSILSRFMAAGYTPVTNLHESLSFMAWCVVLIFLILKWKYKIMSIGIVLSPLASILIVAALFHSERASPLPPILQSYWLPVHATLAFMGEAIFALAFAAAVLYLLQERRIKRKSPGGHSKKFPSLEALDETNYLCLSLGFPLLTAGIITGSLWANYAWGSYWSWDPKETGSLVTWLIYAALLHQRLNVGWRGRKAAIMAIVGFASVIFTFLGVNLLFSGLHSFGRFAQ